MQEVYLDFYQRISKYGFLDINCAEAFLITICKRKLAKYFLKLKTQSTETLNYNIKNIASISEDEAYSRVEENAIDKMTFEKLLYEASAKGDDASEIFKLKFIKGMTFKQIAVKLGKPESTVKSKFYRTLKKQKIV